MEYAREVFANAPLAFVVCEIRFPLAPRLVTDDSLIALTDAFTEVLPVPEEERTEDGGERRFRFLDPQRTVSVVVARDSLSVETTHYTEWAQFRGAVLRVIRTVAARARIAGVERVGLRYINEIRVPESISDISRWRGWISDDVLGPLGVVPGYSPESFQTITHLRGGPNQLIVRCAALVGSGVVSDEPLRRRIAADESPFFVIDTDSYCDTPGEQMTAFAAEDLGSILDGLHQPLAALFHRAITEKSRELFRKES